MSTLLILLSLNTLAHSPAPGYLEEHLTVIRAEFADPEQLTLVPKSWDVWGINRRRSRITMGATAEQMELLRQWGFLVQEDQALSDALRSAPQTLAGQGSGIAGFPCYPTVEETFALGTELTQNWPDLASWIDIGDSWEKEQGQTPQHDLRVLKLTNRNTSGDKPKLFIMSGIHARENTFKKLGFKDEKYGQWIKLGVFYDSDLHGNVIQL